jgi:menaquinol-cytochrome c reductase iron-sulfur subunit
MVKEHREERRGFLKMMALAGVAAGITGVPLATYFISPALNKGTSKWIDLGPVEALKPGQVQMLTYEFLVKDGWLVLPQRGFVWAMRGTDGGMQVLSSTCTHLACNVIWREQERMFECPCHSGRYNSRGEPVAGPPTRPLKALEHRVEEGKLMVYMTV